ncbi:hypothetical protein, partial [Frankia sp. AvcI1]
PVATGAEAKAVLRGIRAAAA